MFWLNTREIAESVLAEHRAERKDRLQKWMKEDLHEVRCQMRALMDHFGLEFEPVPSHLRVVRRKIPE